MSSDAIVEYLSTEYTLQMQIEPFEGPFPELAPLAPWRDAITDYDRMHFITYARLLDANKANLSWEEAARTILYLHVGAGHKDGCAAKACWVSHLERAQWLVTEGLQFVTRSSDNPSLH